MAQLSRRSFTQGGISSLASIHAPVKRPNILVVMMDDFGIGHCAPYAQTMTAADLDPAYADFLKRRKAGYEPGQALEFSQRAMPAVSSIAREGARFTNAFSPSNLCAPARCGVLTGQMQNRFGLYQNSDVEAAGLPKGVVLARHLQAAGYATGFIGKWHAGRRDESLREAAVRDGKPVNQTGYLGAVVREHHPLNHGFDYYYGYNRWECPFYDSEHIWENWEYTGKQARYNTELFTEKAIAFMRRAQTEGKPFFAEVAFHAVHGPLKPQAPERHFSMFTGAAYPLSNFYAHVNAVDAAVAAMREALGAEWDNTLFVFCSDNGAPLSVETPPPGNGRFPGHKGGFLQGGIRVPMLARFPAAFKAGQTRSEIVSMLDIMPTALDAAGVRRPDGLDGRSLLPLLSGERKQVHEHLMWAGIHSRAWGFSGETVIGDAQKRREESPGAWVVTDGKYLLRFVTSTPAGLYKESPDGAPARYELYDLREDPGETRNLHAQLPQVAREMEGAFRERARSLPPPTRWRRDRWEEMMQQR
jgi:uncharacterized sulfatase